ncbi:hypothetical protein D0509_00125 [Weissella cibaria]|uniref:hypothetical protein n=1 Tax=Weissella cibaria TaxID=137591 RepID=UPI0021BE2200|nr:hypothetical protein [Weissella cibaria]MCT8400124.1 hypothetical protein [Weissella cibaria]
MENSIFLVGRDEELDGWVIFDKVTHHILNVNEVTGDEYKALFVKGQADGVPLTTFATREAAYKVLDKLSSIYIEQ